MRAITRAVARAVPRAGAANAARRSRYWRWAALALIIALLAGCAWDTREPMAAGTWVAQRQQAFSQLGEWRVHGRLAISNGEDGGSAGFVLNDSSAGEMRLNLSATGGRWRLVADAGQASLEGSRVPLRRARYPEPLVEHALGWYLPVTLMRDWIRGIPAPPGAQLEFAEDGSLSALNHAQWQIEYQRYREVDGLWLPQKVVATSGDYKVSVIVLGWRLGAAEDTARNSRRRSG